MLTFANFQIFFLVVIFGLFHGLIFLPVLLSLIGPDSHHSKKESEDSDADPDPEKKTNPDSISEAPTKKTETNQAFSPWILVYNKNLVTLSCDCDCCSFILEYIKSCNERAGRRVCNPNTPNCPFMCRNGKTLLINNCQSASRTNFLRVKLEIKHWLRFGTFEISSIAKPQIKWPSKHGYNF